MAPITTLRYCPHCSATMPPNASTTIATPSDAPDEMPSIDGPARGLLKQVCSNSPATASDAPATAAVSIIGTRVSVTMTRHVPLATSPPVMAPHTSAAGISTDPVSRHPAAHSRATAAITAIAIATLRSRHCFIAGKCSIFFQHSETCRRKISRNIYGLTSVLTMSNH